MIVFGTVPDTHCARAAAFSPDGAHLALGLNSGCVSVFEVSNMKPVATVDLNNYGKRQVNGQKGNWIQCMAYSPDGKTLAVGTHGMVIALLDAKTYAFKAALTKHNAAVTHLDWSIDSRHLQSNDLGYELLFCMLSAVLVV